VPAVLRAVSNGVKIQKQNEKPHGNLAVARPTTKTSREIRFVLGDRSRKLIRRLLAMVGAPELEPGTR
jgi:hypothetical protein